MAEQPFGPGVQELFPQQDTPGPPLQQIGLLFVLALIVPEAEKKVAIRAARMVNFTDIFIGSPYLYCCQRPVGLRPSLVYRGVETASSLGQALHLLIPALLVARRQLRMIDNQILFRSSGRD